MRRRRFRVGRSRRSRAAPPAHSSTVMLAAGAVAGAAASVYLARKYGGLAAIAGEVRAGLRGFRDSWLSDSDAIDAADDRALEARVLEAFEEDEILWRRAVEISAGGEGAIELSGWVRTEEEAARAAAVARTVPGVALVLNRVAVRGGGHLDTASTSVEVDDDGGPVSDEDGGLESS